MSNFKEPLDKTVETDVLIIGSGAAGCGAALAAKEKNLNITLVDKGRLESSGALGGGNDHFQAVLNTGPATDTDEAMTNFFQNTLSGLSTATIDKAFAKSIPSVLNFLEGIGVEFIREDDGSYRRTVGFGNPGPWWIHIRNGYNIKRKLASKVRQLGINVIDHAMITKLLVKNGTAVGAIGFNILDGTFLAIKAKTIILAAGKIACRGWNNSTKNPYNIWWSPYNTGSHFVLAYDAGVKLYNLEIGQAATMLPKGYGAPGMNGINSMGGKELNAKGERFMGKYDPQMENGHRRNQILGTYKETLLGNGPPFFEDMTHFSPEDARHLQYVLMPGDKYTYLDWCVQRGIDFTKAPMEVEISELSFGGDLMTRENLETNVKNLFNGCVFQGFSGSMCSGYYAGGEAAKIVETMGKAEDIEKARLASEKETLFRPMTLAKGRDYEEIEQSIQQILDYYVGYARNEAGLNQALDRLGFLEGYLDQMKVSDYRGLMKACETQDLLKLAKLTTMASKERKESGRTIFMRSDYPELDPKLEKPFVLWQENGALKSSWGL